MNETLSPSQASRILEEVRIIMNHCSRNVANAVESFAITMAAEWEDKNAVDFAADVTKYMRDIYDNLHHNNDAFSQTLGEIAASYSRVGGMPIPDLPQDISGAFDSQMKAEFALLRIKETFGGDEFGFKDVDKSAEAILEAFIELKSRLKQTSVDTVSEINKINAFGNTQVQTNLAQSAGQIVSILLGGMSTLHTSLFNKIDATRRAYKKTGANAVTAARISK